MASRVLVIADDVPWRLQCAGELAAGGYVADQAPLDPSLWEKLLSDEHVAFVIGPGASYGCECALVQLLKAFAESTPRIVVLRPREVEPHGFTQVLRTDDGPGSVLGAIETLVDPTSVLRPHETAR